MSLAGNSLWEDIQIDTALLQNSPLLSEIAYRGTPECTWGPSVGPWGVRPVSRGVPLILGAFRSAVCVCRSRLRPGWRPRNRTQGSEVRTRTHPQRLRAWAIGEPGLRWPAMTPRACSRPLQHPKRPFVGEPCATTAEMRPFQSLRPHPESTKAEAPDKDKAHGAQCKEDRPSSSRSALPTRISGLRGLAMCNSDTITFTTCGLC